MGHPREEEVGGGRRVGKRRRRRREGKEDGEEKRKDRGRVGRSGGRRYVMFLSTATAGYNEL